MLIICWAAKGGSGATVTAAALALALAGRSGATLVDLGADAPSALGIAEPSGPGVIDWVVAPSAPAPAALDRLGTAVSADLTLVHRGTAPPGSDHDDRWAHLGSDLAARPTPVVVDGGTGRPPAGLIAAAQHAWLVLRPCYLGVRAAVAQVGDTRPTGLVVVREPGRALTSTDLAAALGTPVVAEIAFDPAVARAVDAGVMATRLPRGMLAELRRAA